MFEIIRLTSSAVDVIYFNTTTSSWALSQSLTGDTYSAFDIEYDGSSENAVMVIVDYS